MNKKAESNIKTLTYAILVFSFLALAGVKFSLDIHNSYGITPNSDFDSLNRLTNESSDTQSTLSKIGASQNQDPNDQDSERGLWAKFKDKVSDSFENSLFARAFQTASLIIGAIGLVGEYIFTIGGILEIPGWVMSFLYILAGLAVTFPLVYFFRSGK